MKRKFSQIRLKNLEILINEAGSAAKLARSAGTNSSYLSQVRNQLPTKNGTPRTIGDDLAIKLEAGMNKPQGWMDDAHDDGSDSDNLSNNQMGSGFYSLYPMISWEQASQWHETAKRLVSPYGAELMPCPIKCGSESFVLRVSGSSMEPKFYEGDFVFVDPGVEPKHGKYVVVRHDDSREATFRQLIVEGGRQYLKALNPDWPNRIIEVDENATICGVAVFTGRAL